jgi:hypothetical protein
MHEVHCDATRASILQACLVSQALADQQPHRSSSSSNSSSNPSTATPSTAEVQVMLQVQQAAQQQLAPAWV